MAKLNIKAARARREKLTAATMASILSLPTSDIPEKFLHLMECKCLKTPLKFHALFLEVKTCPRLEIHLPGAPDSSGAGDAYA